MQIFREPFLIVNVWHDRRVRLAVASSIIALALVGGLTAFLLWLRGPVDPLLGFVGVAAGTLETNIGELSFRDRFSVTERDIVGVAVFRAISDRTTVMATWFSPDERHIPLGRSTLVTASGASIVRFSIAAPGQWAKAPYLLRIDAFRKPGARTASGSTQFFMGMSDREITEYEEEFAQWQKDEAERMKKLQEEEAARSATGKLTIEN